MTDFDLYENGRAGETHFRTKTRFKTETKGSSEMAFYFSEVDKINISYLPFKTRTCVSSIPLSDVLSLLPKVRVFDLLQEENHVPGKAEHK